MGHPKGRHDASEVVCQSQQAELCPDLPQSFHEEITLVMPVLDGPEWTRGELRYELMEVVGLHSS